MKRTKAPQPKRETETIPEPPKVRHLPESGLVDDHFLGEHTPHSRSWYQHARLNGEGPPSYKLGKRTVYKWTEVVAWLEKQLSRAS